MTDPFIAELEAAEEACAPHKSTGCPMCDAINAAETEERRAALRRAAGGTIGIARFVKILRANEIQVGRVFVERHRKEGHTP